VHSILATGRTDVVAREVLVAEAVDGDQENSVLEFVRASLSIAVPLNIKN
jgi:hypothetical protein